jgi:hypothetical protein
MTVRNFKKTREDKLMKDHGTVRVGEEDTSPGGGSMPFSGDQIFWPANGKKPGDLYRTVTAKRHGAGEEASSALVVLLRIVHSLSEGNESIEKCTNSELRECRDICQSIVRGLNDQMLKRANAKHVRK